VTKRLPSRSALKNAVKQGERAAEIHDIRLEILKKTQQIRLLKKQKPINNKLIARLQTKLQTLNDQLQRVQNPLINEISNDSPLDIYAMSAEQLEAATESLPNPKNSKYASIPPEIAAMNNAQLTAAIEALPNNELEAEIGALPNNELEAEAEALPNNLEDEIGALQNDLGAEIAVPQSISDINAQIVILSENLVKEKKQLDVLLKKEKPTQKDRQTIAYIVETIKTLNEKLDELRPPNRNKLTRNVIRAKLELNQAQRTKAHRTKNNTSNSNKLTLGRNVENALKRHASAAQRLTNFVHKNRTRRTRLNAPEIFEPPALLAPRTIVPNVLMANLSAFPKGNIYQKPTPKNAVLKPRPPKRVGPKPSGDKKIAPNKNRTPPASHVGNSANLNRTPPASHVGNSANLNRTPPATHVGNLASDVGNLWDLNLFKPSKLEIEYLESRKNLAAAKAKMLKKTGSYIKNKEDYLVASIRFLLLQKKYVESGGNDNYNFAPFTEGNVSPFKENSSDSQAGPANSTLNRRVALNPRNSLFKRASKKAFTVAKSAAARASKAFSEIGARRITRARARAAAPTVFE
jgi:hypothetical protein